MKGSDTRRSLAAALGLLLATSAGAHQATPTAGDPPLDADKAKNFVEKINDAYYDRLPLLSSAFWLQSTYINKDSQRVASHLNEQQLAWTSAVVKEAAKFNDVEVDEKTRRALRILKVGQTLPAPDDPEKRAELAKITSSMEAMYGSGKYCPEGVEEGSGQCKSLNDLEEVIDNSRDYGALLEAWKGWRTISPPMRDDYVRFVELGNEGAETLGYENLGELWRAGYDMSPAQFSKEVERLWGQVEPLYDELQCYVRGKLETEYGPEHFGDDNLIPAHLLGNMWSQEWSNVYPLVEPYPGASDLDVKGSMEEREWTPKQMVESAENFYESLGLRKLPESFWKNSMFTKPEDREVVCHASAWDMDMKGDVRIKMCIEVNEEDLATIYHELGHLYYDLAYNDQPPIFQSGAHDGFHEAIGDAIVLSMTPEYLAQVGLVDEAPDNEKALINQQLKTALDKIAFLPFGLLIDQWRWRVFSGDIAPGDYNQAWWRLREKYQGIKAPVARGEDHFDPGAKYHIPGNTPYTRYFLARILQFQFHRAMCEAAGHEGPLHQCSVYGNEAAGERFWAMMEKGQSRTWQETLAELTGKPEMDASAIIDYYQPLIAWLKEQNEDRQCGWTASGVSIAGKSRARQPGSGRGRANARPLFLSARCPEDGGMNRLRHDEITVAAAAGIIVQGFDGYNDDFRHLTRRARGRFERREWSRLQDDINERFDLYESRVQRTRSALRELLGAGLANRDLWRSIRSEFGESIRGHGDVEFVKTFYNSVTRRVFVTVGADEAIEFVARDLDPTTRVRGCSDLRRRAFPDRVAGAARWLLSRCPFTIPYANLEESVAFIRGAIEPRMPEAAAGPVTLEALRPVFFQSTRAYLVGRLTAGDEALPLVVALANDDEGIRADAVLTRDDELSVLFGFTRSYFMADLDAVTETVVWLQRILPRKPLAEMFTVLGRAKQGKTETYRALLKHLDTSSDAFRHAPGARGMVMITFTLPSHDVVFKVIRDEFDYPKSVDRQDVLDRYRLVFRHDRAGRLIDAQEFRRLELSRDRFTTELLDELLTNAADTVFLHGNDVVIDHLYTERRLEPLNLYVQRAKPETARRAVLDYGQAIRDLARTNIFPGDLLLKNFGVTRRERVIFYDYDELCLLTECNFRRIPPARSEEELFSAENWFVVDSRDVFPEQFRNFISLPGGLMDLFEEHHGELFDVGYWTGVQQRILDGEVLEILPYR